VDLQVSTDQTRQEKEEDFIHLDNSKAKICRTKTNFSSSPSPSPSASSFFFLLRFPCQPLEDCWKTKLWISNSQRSETAGKTRGFHSFFSTTPKAKTCRETKQAPKKQKKKRKKGKKKLESRTSNALQPDKRERITYSKILPHKTRGNATKSATTRRTSRQAQEQNAPKFKQTPKRTET
jgi:hypothetical protein